VALSVGGGDQWGGTGAERGGNEKGTAEEKISAGAKLGGCWTSSRSRLGGRGKKGELGRKEEWTA